MSFRELRNTVKHFHRRKPLESYQWWDTLNYAQKFSVTSLFQFGYDIEFVRVSNQDSIVVMSLDGVSVTVNHEGVIDTQPKLNTRRNSR